MNKKSKCVINYRIRIKQKLIDYKGGQCQKCGYNKPVPGAYHFHHRDAKQKAFEINGCTFGFEKQKEEVDKCDLLCANCHAEIHDLDWVVKRQDAFIVKRSKVSEKCCGDCGEQFKPKRREQMYCSRKCQHNSMKHFPRLVP